MRKLAFILLVLGVLSAGQSGLAQNRDRLEIHHADDIEYVFSALQDTTYATGSVIFETESGLIYCDSAIWIPGKEAVLRGRVVIDDRDFRLAADSVHYDLKTFGAIAVGDYVELYSRLDSLFAIGTYAYNNRQHKYFYMLDRPTLYLNYPDMANLVEVIGDYIEYRGEEEIAEASGNVRISTNDITALSGCAVMKSHENTLDLFDHPVLHRNKSEITGQFITVNTSGRLLSRVDVVDSAYGEFVEPADSAETRFNRSILSGQRMILDFEGGDLRYVTSHGQAYSWYYPVKGGDGKIIENSVSGDDIVFTVENEQLVQVDVDGGAIGTYLSTSEQVRDTLVPVDTTEMVEAALPDSSEAADTSGMRTITVIQQVTDTIDYGARHITYNLPDSLIRLTSRASTNSGSLSLEAYMIELNTGTRVVEAYSGATHHDSITSANIFAEQLQPNEIPVVLKDREQTLYGDYLRYSLDTEKGRIVTSKSDYETGFFYGDNLYRQKRNVFYLEDGRYTTCDADEPHFHFYSKHLKLIEGDKLIAKPVVMHIGRLPILALPYYVFPLKKGRHSGILPFTFGNIEQGERYVRNVGYYWAVSEYWDWQGAVDYYEESSRVNFFSRVTYNKRYCFNGTVSGNYARQSDYSYSQGREIPSKRWTISGSHNHELSPSFKISATGQLQSDSRYYNDFSTNLEERLNRVVRSKINFTKKFGKSVSVSGLLSHDDQLDEEARTDQLPSISVSLPTIRPFGSGSLNDEGKLERHWYNEFIISYRPNMINYSSRVTNKEVLYDTLVTYDTLYVDSSPEEIDTIIVDTSFIVTDTLSERSRKKYTRVDHSMSLSFPTKIAGYITFNPSVSYTENWYKIFKTDQSDAKDIDASTTYRTYLYSVGASVKTDIYGTVYPNVLGLVGLRQVLTPSVSYRFTPEINRHPEIRSYAGGGAGSTRRSQTMSFSLKQVYQAKIKQAESERNLELVSITSSFGYDFEKDTRRLSDLSTSFSSTLLPKINFYGSANHSFYKEDSDELDFFSPRLLNFNLSAGISLHGRHFLFDEEASAGIPRGADSASHLSRSHKRSALSSPSSSGWSLSASYGYSESGVGTEYFSKKSYVRFSLRFNLTPETKVTYSQYYDFVDKKTISNEVNIERTLHCWTGIFHWVPTGSTRGWGFKLYVTGMPDIKIDNSQSAISSSLIQDFR